MTNPDVIIWEGDVLAALALMDDESVDTVVTSPPYWGLRDYGVEGQIGMEPSLAEHLEVLVAVFDEVRRVMKPEATLWLNYGDCYASSVNGRSAADTKLHSDDDRTFRDKPFSTVGPIDRAKTREVKRWGGGNAPSGPILTPVGGSKGGGFHQKSGVEHPHVRVAAGGYLKSKDLCMVANRLAIALQDAGWWVRSEIIWHKPNPMPESVTDRPATSHEKVFLLTKSERYHYDVDAVRVAATSGTQDRYERGRSETHKYADGGPGNQTISKSFGHMRKHPSESNPSARPPRSNPQSGLVAADENTTGTRNLRNVWTIPTAPFPGAHFATFPPALVEPCIKAGCPKGGVVLDPFGGAGTVAMVASRLQRRAVLIELNPEYADIAEKRIRADTGPMFHTLERRQVLAFDQMQWGISEAGKGID